MTDKRPSSTKLRRECFEANKWQGADGRWYLTCHICKGHIDPAREPWEAEHSIRRVLTRDDGPTNVRPAHTKGCHEEKTKRDISENAKGKRVSDKSFGIVRKKGFDKRYRKRMDGTVERRS